MSQDNRSNGRSGVRAFIILELFGQRQCPLRAIDIIAATDWASSSVDQLLKSLVFSGFLLFDQRTKLYHPSPRLLNFSVWLGGEAFGSPNLQDLVSTVFRETNEFAVIVAQNDCFMQVVSCAGPDEWYDETRYDAKFSLVDSICGRAMISAYEDRDVRYFAHRARYFAGSSLDERAAVEVAKETRAAGFSAGDARPQTRSLCPAEVRSSLWAVAMYLPRALTGGQPLALSLAGPEGRMRGNEPALSREIRRIFDWAVSA